MTPPHGLPDRFSDVEPMAATPIERSFRAFDRVLERPVIVRLPAVSAWAGWTAPVRERLLREARALAKVQHEGVLPILWVEETPEGPLLVQPPPPGERLAERLAAGPMAVDAVVALGIDVAQALAAVHYAGIVHRGIGADAVWLRPDGRALLGSFTFAKAYDARLPSSIDHARKTDSVAAGVLPPYPAPEQLAGKAAEPRVDVWALGCLLYRCVTGEDPALAGGPATKDVRSVRRDVPKAVSMVLRTCMQPAATARYATAREVAEALAKAREEPQPMPSRRHLLTAGAGLAVLGTLAAWRPWVSAAPPHRDPGEARTTTGADKDVYSNSYARGHALLIGNAGYRGPHVPLNGPINEVEAVASRLREIDPIWQAEGAIQILRDASSEQIADALEHLKTGPGVGPEDAVFVYYAGHAVIKDRDSGYWLVATEAADAEPGQNRIGFVDSRYLQNLADYCPAKHVFVVLDCCHGGRMLLANRGAGRPTRPPEADGNHAECLRFKARQMLASCGASKQASDAPVGGISKFCHSFLDALAPGTEPKLVTPSILRGAIEAALGGASQRPQLDESGSDLDRGGTFVFFVPKKP